MQDEQPNHSPISTDQLDPLLLSQTQVTQPNQLVLTSTDQLGPLSSTHIRMLRNRTNSYPYHLTNSIHCHRHTDAGYANEPTRTHIMNSAHCHWHTVTKLTNNLSTPPSYVYTHQLIHLKVSMAVNTGHFSTKCQVTKKQTTR